MFITSAFNLHLQKYMFIAFVPNFASGTRSVSTRVKFFLDTKSYFFDKINCVAVVIILFVN